MGCDDTSTSLEDPVLAGVDGVCGVKSVGDAALACAMILAPEARAAALRCALQRCLSHAGLVAIIRDAYGEGLSYIYSLLRSRPDDQLYKWALRTRGDLKPMTSWLLLAAVVDVLSILRSASRKMQRHHMLLCMAQQVTGTCAHALDGYFCGGWAVASITGLPRQPPLPPRIPSGA